MITLGLSALPCGDVAAHVVPEEIRALPVVGGGGKAEFAPEVVGRADPSRRIPVFLWHGGSSCGYVDMSIPGVTRSACATMP